jgi:hypothetical protein
MIKRDHSKLDYEKKEAFLRAVRGVLFNFDGDYQINSNADTLQSIPISKMTCFDGIMSVVLRFLLLLKRVFGLLDLAYGDHLRFRSLSNKVTR